MVCQNKAYLHRNRKVSNQFTLYANSILFYYSPVKSCQESTCQNVVFPPDKYKHRKILGKPYNVQRKAALYCEVPIKILSRQCKSGNLVRKKPGPQDSLPTACVRLLEKIYQLQMGMIPNVAPRRYYSFLKKNDVIMLISPTNTIAAFQIFDRQIMAYLKHVGNNILNIASTNITMENCKGTTCNFY
jgi:hypothetical protein